eukprot:6199525-Pleurochrysis_carterae.AAC.2
MLEVSSVLEQVLGHLVAKLVNTLVIRARSALVEQSRVVVLETFNHGGAPQSLFNALRDHHVLFGSGFAAWARTTAWVDCRLQAARPQLCVHVHCLSLSVKLYGRGEGGRLCLCGNGRSASGSIRLISLARRV